MDAKIAQTGQIAPFGTSHPSSAGVAPEIRGDETLAMAPIGHQISFYTDNYKDTIFSQTGGEQPFYFFHFLLASLAV